MNRTNQSELDEVIRRMQRGENLERRRKRPEDLDEYFRRRNALVRRVAPPPIAPVPESRGGTPAPEATHLGGKHGMPANGRRVWSPRPTPDNSAPVLNSKERQP